MSRAEQEREEFGHAVYMNWCVACVEGRCVQKHLQVEPLEEEERERTTPMATFDCCFLTQENADTFSFLICRDHRKSQTGVRCCERKDPTSYLISFLVDWKILSKDENESSLKVFQDAWIHSSVEVAVRETKRQCRNLRSSAEHNTSVRITFVEDGGSQWCNLERNLVS